MEAADSIEKIIAWLVLLIVATALAFIAYRYRRAAKEFAVGLVGGLILGFAALFGASAVLWATTTVLR